MRDPSPWPERDGELRALWAEGHSAAQIGRKMGLSKNSVMGRVHRLKLAGRPSPIAGGARGSGHGGHGGPRGGAGERAAATARAQLSRDAGAPITAAKGSASLRGDTLGALGLRFASVESVSPVAAPAEPRVVHRAGQTCRWPIGEPGTKGFRYCDAPGVVARRSYCPEHCAVARASEVRLVADAAAPWARPGRARAGGG